MSTKAEAYFEQIRNGATLAAVARAHGCSISGVGNALKRAGLPSSFSAAQAAGLAEPGALQDAKPRDPRPEQWRGGRTGPGWCGYADILRSVMFLPGTSLEVSKRFDIHVNRMRVILNRFHDLGVLHIGGWKKRDCRIPGAAMAVFHLGKGQDVPGSKNGPTRKPRKLAAQHEQTQMVHVMRLLVEPITKDDLALASGSSERTTSRFLNHLHSIGLCHIADWVPSPGGRGGNPTAMFQLGRARDAARPIPLTPAQMSRNAWERRKERNRMQRLIAATASNAGAFADAQELEAA